MPNLGRLNLHNLLPRIESLTSRVDIVALHEFSYPAGRPAC
jgi:hypothetical protein